MTSFGWLHLTDLHHGGPGHAHLWPNVRDAFFRDLKRMHDICGPWQAVLFTGDLVQQGKSAEFDECDRVLAQVWEFLDEIGSKPRLFAVPGNHDLVRPRASSSAVEVLRKWEQHPEIHDDFWNRDKSPYRKVVEKAFANYKKWWDNTPYRGGQPSMSGLLPGEYSATFETGSLRIGIVGLNSAFLQLTGENYEGRLVWDVRQLHAACGGDGPGWVMKHDLCLLLTHHPPTWLSEASRTLAYPELAPAGRFAVQLVGHLHSHQVSTISHGGGPYRRVWQGCSMFSNEIYGDGRPDRRHGYAAGRVTLKGNRIELRHWPRVARLSDSNGWEFGPDLDGYSLLRDEGTRAEHIEPSTPRKRPARGPHRREGARISISQLPYTDFPELVGREVELAQLDRAWEDPATGIVTIVARGGMGKTSLVKRWLQILKPPGPRRIYGYSFYRRNTVKLIESADEFIQGTLRWLGDSNPHQGTPQEKGMRLADLVRAEPTLLILDGIEPLQFPPGAARRGEIRDEALRTLLLELATMMNGLCVVTTRFAMTDLKQFESATVLRIDLGPLSPESGAKLLASLGVVGEISELRSASQDAGGDSLALTLLGTYLSSAWGGQVEHRQKIAFAAHDKHLRGHAWKVMSAYEEWFRERPQLSAVLRILGLFDRPATTEAVAAVIRKEEAAFPGLTEHLVDLQEDEYRKVLASLREARLLYEEDPSDPGKLDTHPMIREFFGLLLKQSSLNAWREGHSRLFEYFRASAAAFPATLEEMTPLYLAVAHGCEANLHQDALDDVYWRRIARGTAFVGTRALGAVGADLTTLAGFFRGSWSKPVTTITESDRAFVLGQAAFNLWALGRLSEMLKPQMQALKISIQQEDWVNASSSALNLCDYYVTTARFDEALSYADESVRLVQRIDVTKETRFDPKRYAQQCVSLQVSSGDAFLATIMLASRGDVLHHMGRLKEAATSFEKAERLQREVQVAYPFLYSLPGYWYTDLLLRLREYPQVMERAEATLHWIEPSGVDLLAVALSYLVLAQAEYLHSEGRNVSLASSHIEKAVNLLEASGHMDYLPHGLLARAELRRSTGQLTAAKSDLDAVMIIARRASMRIHEIDCYIGYWRLHRDQGELGQAKRAHDRAVALIRETGYGRHVPVLQGDEFVIPEPR